MKQGCACREQHAASGEVLRGWDCLTAVSGLTVTLHDNLAVSMLAAIPILIFKMGPMMCGVHSLLPNHESTTIVDQASYEQAGSRSCSERGWQPFMQ